MTPLVSVVMPCSAHSFRGEKSPDYQARLQCGKGMSSCWYLGKTPFRIEPVRDRAGVEYSFHLVDGILGIAVMLWQEVHVMGNE